MGRTGRYCLATVVILACWVLSSNRVTGHLYDYLPSSPNDPFDLKYPYGSEEHWEDLPERSLDRRQRGFSSSGGDSGQSLPNFRRAQRDDVRNPSSDDSPINPQYHRDPPSDRPYEEGSEQGLEYHQITPPESAAFYPDRAQESGHLQDAPHRYQPDNFPHYKWYDPEKTPYYKWYERGRSPHYQRYGPDRLSQYQRYEADKPTQYERYDPKRELQYERQSRERVQQYQSYEAGTGSQYKNYDTDGDSQNQRYEPSMVQQHQIYEPQRAPQYQPDKRPQYPSNEPNRPSQFPWKQAAKDPDNMAGTGWSQQNPNYDPAGVPQYQRYEPGSTPHHQGYQTGRIPYHQGYQPGMTPHHQGYQPGTTPHHQGYQPGMTPLHQGYQPGMIPHHQGYQPGMTPPHQGYQPGMTPPDQRYQMDMTPPHQGYQQGMTPHHQGYQPDMAPPHQGYQMDMTPPHQGYQPGMTPPHQGYQPEMTPLHQGYQLDMAPPHQGYQPDMVLHHQRYEPHRAPHNQMYEQGRLPQYQKYQPEKGPQYQPENPRQYTSKEPDRQQFPWKQPANEPGNSLKEPVNKLRNRLPQYESGRTPQYEPDRAPQYQEHPPTHKDDSIREKSHFPGLNYGIYDTYHPIADPYYPYHYFPSAYLPEPEFTECVVPGDQCAPPPYSAQQPSGSQLTSGHDNGSPPLHTTNYSGYKSFPQDAGCAWQMAFKAVSGNGRKVVDDFYNPGDLNWKHQNARDIESDIVFRHGYILDNWERLAIDKVKLEIFKSGERKVWFLFDGVGSTLENWMTKDRLICSPYEDIKSGTFEFFGVTGHTDWGRTFYIARPYGFDCSDDCGYITVADSSPTPPCAWESSATNPLFLYSAVMDQCGLFGNGEEILHGDRLVVSTKICFDDV